MKIASIGNNLNFTRLLTPVEKIENRMLTDDAKKAIGLEHIVLVTHSPSIPSSSDEDTGIGILSMNKGAISYINFAYDNGIDGISVEPCGIISGELYSPYEGSVLSKKPVIDLKALTTEKWAGILDEKTAEEAVNGKNYNVSIPDKTAPNGHRTVKFDTDRVIYDYVLETHKKAMEKAFDNFNSKVEQGDLKALEINKEFEAFKDENNYYLKGDAIFSVLSELHGTKNFYDWDNELHRTLFDKSDLTFSQEEKDAEIAKIELEHKKEVEFFKFSQFVANKQQNELSDYASKIGRVRYEEDLKTIEKALQAGEISPEKFNYLKQKLDDFNKNAKGVNIIGDKQIGYSKMDIWSNPSIFTKDEFMGAPPNLVKGHFGQDWNFNFIPQENLFKEDGSLNEGGLYLKKVIKKAFKDNPGGLRIDHVLGMIDPWSYKKGETNDVTPTKFNVLLLTHLKGLQPLGITQDAVFGLKDPLGAITGENKEERQILKERGVEAFDKANEIIEEKKNFIEEIKGANACTGSRRLFKIMIDNELSPLRELGFNEESVTGVIDPIGGILNPDGKDRKILEQRGIKDFDKAASIVAANKGSIIKEYSKLLTDIVLSAGFEVVKERSDRLGLNLSEEEIEAQAKALLICEDLGAVTEPAKWVMKDLGLTGMRHACYSDPNDSKHIYRECNPEEQGNYWLVGSHDSPPYVKEVQKYDDATRKAHVDYITGELGIDSSLMADKSKPYEFVRGKIARLFAADKDPKTPNNILLNWLDLFANENTYNVPGLNSKEINWNLRVAKSGDSFEKTYFEETLPQRKGINIPEALSIALEATDKTGKYEELDKGLKKSASIMEE